jgi:imidazolonepropionase-like amidohydrolase
MNLPLIAGGYANAAANVVRILHAGGRVGVATDSGGLPTAFFGVFYAEELRRLVRLGLSNYQTLKAATSGNAEILGLQDKLGSIRPGRLADLIVVDGNPLADLDAVLNVRMVMKGGRFLKGAPIHPRLSSLHKPLPQDR